MPHFVVHALDAAGKAEARSAARPAHRARLRDHDHPLNVHVAGPMLDPDGAMCGTLLIVEAETADAVRAFVDGDPYVAAGVYGQVRINAFNWGLGQPEAAHG